MNEDLTHASNGKLDNALESKKRFDAIIASPKVAGIQKDRILDATRGKRTEIVETIARQFGVTVGDIEEDEYDY